MNKIKVLEVSIVSNNTGGVEKFLYDVFVHMDKSELQVDFLSPAGGSYDMFKKQIEEGNGRVLNLGTNRESVFGKIKYNFKFYFFLKKNHYDIIHINSGAFFFCLQVAAISKMCKIKKIITHSHNNTNYKPIKKAVIAILKPILKRLSDVCLACSKDAAKTIFPNKSVQNGEIRIIKNGIDIQKFRFREDIRAQYREEMGIQNEIVCGHIGRFEGQKNHDFLIDVFSNLLQVNSDMILLLVGVGPLEKSIKCKVEQLGIDGKVRFLGQRTDVNKLLSCMDIFLLPSLYEGLPIVAVEAQTNGLLTICADTITDETNISDMYHSVPSTYSAEQWALLIMEAKVETKKEDRKSKYNQVVAAGYEIENVAEELRQIYLKNGD